MSRTLYDALGHTRDDGDPWTTEAEAPSPFLRALAREGRLRRAARELADAEFREGAWVEAEPAPATATLRLAAQDEARHVAFGLAHLRRHAQTEPELLSRLTMAVHRRHDALQHTAGLNEEVFDALVLLAAGSWEHEDIERGWAAVEHAGGLARIDRPAAITDIVSPFSALSLSSHRSRQRLWDR